MCWIGNPIQKNGVIRRRREARRRPKSPKNSATGPPATHVATAKTAKPDHHEPTGAPFFGKHLTHHTAQKTESSSTLESFEMNSSTKSPSYTCQNGILIAIQPCGSTRVSDTRETLGRPWAYLQPQEDLSTCINPPCLRRRVFLNSNSGEQAISFLAASWSVLLVSVRVL